MADLDAVLSHLTGRHLTVKDIQHGLGMAKGTYYAQKEEGRLTQPVNLLKLARAFGVNPLELLVHYGHIGADDIAGYTGRLAKTGVLHQAVNAQSVTVTDGEDLVIVGPEKVVEVIVEPKTGTVHNVVRPTANAGRKLVMDIPATVESVSQERLIELLHEAVENLRVEKVVEYRPMSH